MRNINRLLENSKRCDVRGYNLYSMGRYAVTEADYRVLTTEKWSEPRPGLFGAVAIGYEIDIPDPVLPRILADGREVQFSAVRHRWTPAYTDTYYRSSPMGEYRVAGTLVMRERKCFTADDTFISHLEFVNDDTAPVSLDISLSVPFSDRGNGEYLLQAQAIVAGLGRKPMVSGFVVVGTSRGTVAHLDLWPHGKASIAYGFAFSKKSGECARNMLAVALGEQDPFFAAEERFNRWMAENAPCLDTENSDLLKVYYYRWFLIKSAIHTPSDVLDDPIFSSRAIYESPFGGWFGCPIGLPVPLQLEEMRWFRSAAVVRDQIKAWCEATGNTQNYIQYTPLAILRYYRQRGDLAMLRAAYPACRAFTLKKSTEKTPERLPVTRGSWQTGAEYQPSFYQYTDPAWDWRCDVEGIRQGIATAPRGLYRVDECSIHVANLRACRDIATILDLSDDAVYFEKAAVKAEKELVDLLWSEKSQAFLDRDATTGLLCDQAQSFAGFYPFALGIGTIEHVRALDVLNGARFDGGFSVTTADTECPMYWFDSHIVQGGGSTKESPHHYASAWNGAIWPFATTVVLEAVGATAIRAPEYRPLFLRLFGEYTDLHFMGGDRSLPCIVEHYRVSDGYPLSPYTEYFHSKWIDLFLSYWAGIGLAGGHAVFAPMTDENFVLDGVVLGNNVYRFEQKNGRRSISYTDKQ